VNTFKKLAAVAAMSAAALTVAGVGLAATRAPSVPTVKHVCESRSHALSAATRGDLCGSGAHRVNWAVQGPAVPAGMAGAVYRVEHYANGIGSGGVATVACANNDTTSQQYVAISGGIEADPGTNLATINPLAVAASFPGRMDWTTNTPKPGRLDGWVIQLAPGSASDATGSVWALCAPVRDFGGSLPVQTNEG
jgi:hypothetical protein